MERYDDKIVSRNNLFTDYESFMFLEGQTGLPDLVKEIHDHIRMYRPDSTWVVDDIFQKPDRIKAIPHLNPSVLIFQTTMMSCDKIDRIIEYLQSEKWSPKEIWQIIRDDIPIVDSDSYDVFAPSIYDGELTLMKL